MRIIDRSISGSFFGLIGINDIIQFEQDGVIKS